MERVAKKRTKLQREMDNVAGIRAKLQREMDNVAGIRAKLQQEMDNAAGKRATLQGMDSVADERIAMFTRKGWNCLEQSSFMLMRKL